MKKLKKRNAVVAAIVLFLCVATYLNWSYASGEEVSTVDGKTEETGKTLGEAVLVDGGDKTGGEVLTGDYFASARLSRQQARDSAMNLLRESAANDEVGQTVKDEANVSIQTMATQSLMESEIENLVIAKGYADCVAFVGDSSASIVVAAQPDGLQSADVAKIAEIAMEETGFSATKIKIIEAE